MAIAYKQQLMLKESLVPQPEPSDKPIIGTQSKMTDEQIKEYHVIWMEREEDVEMIWQ